MPEPRHRGRDPEDIVRIEDQGGTRSWRLFLGRGLWRAIGSPARIELRRSGGALHVAPVVEAEGDVGYAVSTGANTIPRVSIGRGPAEELRLVVGKYAAAVRRDEIVTRFEAAE